MKKFLILLVIFTLVGGYVMGLGRSFHPKYTGPEPSGVTVGGMLALPDITGTYNKDFQLALVPFVEYSDTVAEGMDLHAVLGLPLGLIGFEDSLGQKSMVLDVNFEGDFIYSDLMPSLDVGAWVYADYRAVPDDFLRPLGLTLGPWAKYTMPLGDIGDFYAKAQINIDISSQSFSELGLSMPLTAGLNMPNGIGVEITPKFRFAPSGPGFEFFDGLNITATYVVTQLPLYVEVGLDFPPGFKVKEMGGIGLDLYGEYEFMPDWRAFAGLQFNGIGVEDGMMFSPRLGVKYSLGDVF